MDTISRINQEAWELWEDTFQDNDNVYVPMIYPTIKKERILFIGLNPSFNERSFRITLKDTPYSNIDPKKDFHWSNRADFNPEIAEKFEVRQKEVVPFFAKFREIAEYTSMNWEHIDLFFYRETSQKHLTQLIYPKNKLSDFGRRQIELSKQLILEAIPKVIVVANAFASRLFKNEVFKEELKEGIDEEHGYHVLRLNGRAIPVFLASMLTGQRAMDNYSYERLKWHIKKSLVLPCN